MAGTGGEMAEAIQQAARSAPDLITEYFTRWENLPVSLNSCYNLRIKPFIDDYANLLGWEIILKGD